MSDPAATIEAFLDGAEIEYVRTAPGQWAAMLRGEHKLTIPVALTVRGEVLHLESFFMRHPQENLDRFYELLLRRNARSYGIAFALDSVGDVYLVGERGVAGLSEDELDRILGAVVTEADGLFMTAIEIGFESYLEADRKWRASSGHPTTPPSN